MGVNITEVRISAVKTQETGLRKTQVPATNSGRTTPWQVVMLARGSSFIKRCVVHYVYIVTRI